MGNRETAIRDRLQYFETKYRDGEKERFIEAIDLCFTFGVEVPEWAAHHFCCGAQLYLTAKKRTMDEAFDVKRPKSWSQERHHKLHAKVPAAIGLVKIRCYNGEKSGKALAAVAKKLHMSEGDISRIYYDKKLNPNISQKTPKTDPDTGRKLRETASQSTRARETPRRPRKPKS